MYIYIYIYIHIYIISYILSRPKSVCATSRLNSDMEEKGIVAHDGLRPLPHRLRTAQWRRWGRGQRAYRDNSKIDPRFVFSEAEPDT